ncbi:molybdopterin-dependent oxidoreductase [Desulfobacula phenolica]|uniref:Oxidoreductase molybdopterin binding domain-containing protein n=1 Tax=Desulfobacula phenolica TaxID=90732 RepID=A0A1H2J311_9BACT|nr:molybdopterin-dependent oxidoreductase [Desulfobacula phenolica]SDU50813.1 Oxidoreductase molybdopterin binding domain-containing protein [Desulfobacula phenolica]
MKSIMIKCQLVILAAAVCLFFFQTNSYASQKRIKIHGAVEEPLNLTLKEIQAMSEFHINAVSILKEKQNKADKEKLIEVADYGGVLLRDILEKAGMKYKRKWEPAVFIRVKGIKDEEVIFSFGEIFYSSIGRSTLLTYRKDGKLIGSSNGCPGLIVSNDIRNGRRIKAVTEIIVERVDIKMKVYEERKKNILQPSTSYLELIDKKSGNTQKVTFEDLTGLPELQIHDKVQIGDCEGFHGVYSYEGVTLRSFLEKQQFVSQPYFYDRYVAVHSENGFCATFSIGELFNSKLGNNIVMAYKKDGKMLAPDEGFLMMVAGEDNTGGRSVKRISNIIIF